MTRRKRDVLESAVNGPCRTGAKADELDEATGAGLGGSNPITIHAKML
jgi:hypothetical protein